MNLNQTLVEAQTIVDAAFVTAGTKTADGSYALSFASTEEVVIFKKELTLAAAELRLLKRSVNDDQRAVRQQYTDKASELRAVASATRVVAGRRGFFGRAVSGVQQQQVRNVADQKREVMAEYDRTKAQIDRHILTMSRAKSELDLAAAKAV